MQVILNTDHTVTASDELSARVEAGVTAAIDRFGERVTRVEVHLNDENGRKAGPGDKRCMIEARVRGHPPVAVTARAADFALAIAAASDKLSKAVSSLLGRIEDKRAATEPAPGE